MSETSDETSTPCVAVVGTCDTKLAELLYVRTQLLEFHNVRVKLVDVGRTPSTHPAVDVSQSTILATSPSSSSRPWDTSTWPPTKSGRPPEIFTLSRNDLITTLSAHAAPLLASLVSSHTLHGILALGGSGGSALASGIFAALPLGFPKLLVSTMAAGDVSPFVRDADVALIHSVVDIAGLNDILCPILENAAGAIAGMARAYHARLVRTNSISPKGEERERKKRIAITMFGVTTPAVTHARTLLSRYPCTTYVFHATGSGGHALERLISDAFFEGVLDLTTTELADELVGGVLSAGPHRLEAASRSGVPQVVSLGALDMVNFGPRSTVPDKWAGKGRRRLCEHNPSVTLMRTTREECAQLGRIIAEKLLLRAHSPESSADKGEGEGGKVNTEVWIPCRGVSMLSAKGGPFENREADEALFGALKDGLAVKGDGTKINDIKVVERDMDINDPGFVEGMVTSLVRMMHLDPLDVNVAER